jgi:menaquinone-dependent protoporphyrinogen oxidase
MSRILLPFASSNGQTQRIAETLAMHLRQRGHEVELVDALAMTPPSPVDYDAAVIGSRVQMGRHANPIVEYMVRYRAELAAMPSAFFSVSMSAATANCGDDPEHYLAQLFERVKMRPTTAVALGGGLPYRRYGWVMRMVMKAISKRAGHPTDTTKNHDCTDWNAVAAFARQIDAMLPAAVRSPATAPSAGAVA